MKKNFMSVKHDFDKYLKSNITGKQEENYEESITAKESQLREILKISDQRSSPNDMNQEITNHDEMLSHNNNEEEPLQNEAEGEQDKNSLSSILSGINQIDDKEDQYFSNASSPSSFSSSSSSSNTLSISSSTDNSDSSQDIDFKDSDDDSIFNDIKKNFKKKNNRKRNNKHSKKRKSSKLSSS